MKKTKNNKKILEAIDASKVYEPIDAIKILKENKYAKFNETLDVAINLGIDPNKTDQGIRGVNNLPKGTGKSIKIAVLTKGDKQTEAKEAGADFFGLDEYLEKIKNGWVDFDVLITSCPLNIRPINKKSINTITSVTLSSKMDPSTNDLFIFFNKLRW